MLRITGILCGSALAVALLVLVLGMPDLVENETQQAMTTPEPESQPGPKHEPKTGPPMQPEKVMTPTPQIEASIPRDEMPAQLTVTDKQQVDALFAPVDTPSTEPPETAAAGPASKENWYAFWSPFRSEIAANGFVDELQRTTGLDYRIVKQKAGVYEVAFAYIDGADVDSKLAAIAAATGLEMAGGE